jgi:hypothetical protein
MKRGVASATLKRRGPTPRSADQRPWEVDPGGPGRHWREGKAVRKTFSEDNT